MTGETMVHEVYTLRCGGSALVVSMPHCGTGLFDGLEARLTPEALDLADTDWHIPELYDFAVDFDATIIAARLSRYVVDLNRPSSGESLYPGQATTGLCPTTLFDGRPLYLPGAEPDAAEIAGRVASYWQPYHAALAAELDRAKAVHGHALLWDAHSIRGVVPRLFEGRLPDLNIGTARGASMSPERRARVAAAAEAAAGPAGYGHVVDGRFVGGHITRSYGRPDQGVEAIQMELVQKTYMEENGPPFSFLPERAARIRPVLKAVMAAFIG
jgi:formiminoglutamase